MKTGKTKTIIIILLIIISVILCDQISKIIVRHKVTYHTEINVLGDYLILTKVENTGAFLGLGDSVPRPLYIILMIILPLAAIGFAFYFLVKKNDLPQLFVSGVSLIISGGLGNIIDRILFGSVTDFLYFDFILFHTGIVNIADIAVTAGFFMILAGYLFNREKYSSLIQ